MQLSWLTGDDVPSGFVYRPEFVSKAEERDLVEAIRGIEFSEVKMRGAVVRRRTAHCGGLYGYERTLTIVAMRRVPRLADVSPALRRGRILMDSGVRS